MYKIHSCQYWTILNSNIYSYTTLLAREQILLYPCSFSSLPTTPSLAIILVPSNSPLVLLIKTQALSPKLTVDPSGLVMFLCLVRTTTARTMSPFLTLFVLEVPIMFWVKGFAFWTTQTILSPILAGVCGEPFLSTLMHSTIWAPELSITLIMDFKYSIIDHSTDSSSPVCFNTKHY